MKKLGLTFTVITEAHLGLTQTNGVLSSGDTIILLKLDLVDALLSQVSFLRFTGGRLEAIIA